MKSRVNISYSVDLDTLPDEVRRLLELAYMGMEEILGFMKGFKDPLSLESFNHTDQVRQKLAALDVSLADINNIISSYLNYKVAGMTPPSAIEEPSLPVEAPENLEVTMDTLQEKLAFFKQTLESTTDEVPD